MRRLGTATFITLITFMATAAFGCYQVWGGKFAQIRSTELKGRITLDDGPVPKAVLQLHNFVPVHESGRSAEYPPLKPAPQVLRTAIADKSGMFTFGKLPPGKYVIVMTKPSNEYIAVELLAPDERSQQFQLWIKGSNDWCHHEIAEPAMIGVPH